MQTSERMPIAGYGNSHTVVSLYFLLPPPPPPIMLREREKKNEAEAAFPFSRHVSTIFASISFVLSLSLF